jgi:hypothetical protein
MLPSGPAGSAFAARSNFFWVSGFESLLLRAKSAKNPQTHNTPRFRPE